MGVPAPFHGGHDIVTQGHGGTMSLESEEGQGASFVITLPLAQPDAESEA